MTSYTTLHVENFKGIREMALEGLGMVNVFVGGNNVGKTSVLQAIQLASFLDFNEKQLRESFATNHHLKKMTINDMARQTVRMVSELWGERKQAEDLLYIASLNNVWSLMIDQHHVKFSKNDFFSNNHSRKKIKIQAGTDQHGNIVFFMKAYEHQFLATHIFPELKKDVTFLYQLVEKAINNLQKQALINSLKPLQKNLVTIELLNQAIGCQLLGANKLLNVKEMGEGFLKFALLKALLLTLETPYIFIDEIENGFHYSVQEDMWRMVLEAAKNDGTQFFFTTHSYEVLESLNAMTKKITAEWEQAGDANYQEGQIRVGDDKSPMEPVCVFSLAKDTEDVVTYKRFTGRSLSGAIKRQMELRGKGCDDNDN